MHCPLTSSDWTASKVLSSSSESVPGSSHSAAETLCGTLSSFTLFFRSECARLSSVTSAAQLDFLVRLCVVLLISQTVFLCLLIAHELLKQLSVFYRVNCLALFSWGIVSLALSLSCPLESWILSPVVVSPPAASCSTGPHEALWPMGAESLPTWVWNCPGPRC